MIDKEKASTFFIVSAHFDTDNLTGLIDIYKYVIYELKANNRNNAIYVVFLTFTEKPRTQLFIIHSNWSGLYLSHRSNACIQILNLHGAYGKSVELRHQTADYR